MRSHEKIERGLFILLDSLPLRTLWDLIKSSHEFDTQWPAAQTNLLGTSKNIVKLSENQRRSDNNQHSEAIAYNLYGLGARAKDHEASVGSILVLWHRMKRLVH